MKKIVIATLALGLGIAGTSAFAETVTDHYKSVIQQTPYSVEVCRDVLVSGDKTGDALAGALIGGIIGNNVGNIENGGAAGAIIGGILGHNNSNASGGTQRVCNVETRYEETQSEVYSHSIVTFMYNGKQQRLRFVK